MKTFSRGVHTEVAAESKRCTRDDYFKEYFYDHYVCNYVEWRYLGGSWGVLEGSRVNPGGVPRVYGGVLGDLPGTL